MNRFISFYVLPLILMFGLLFSGSTLAGVPEPVSDELLESLGLDRAYHKCISVADGDTLTLEGLGTVRIVGVDTPEKNHPKLPVQFMSKEAGAFTEKICLGKKVRIEYDPYDKDKRGNYGRVLGYVYLEDGTFLQEELIKNGYAITYTKYPLDEDRKVQFFAWEQAAKSRNRGLWKDDGFSEILWILEQRQPLLQVAKISKDQWRIGFGDWILKPVPSADVGGSLMQLYSTIYEFSPRELRVKLAQMRYKEMRAPDKGPNNIFVIGMAHKKWGVIHKNYALPRVLPRRLNAALQQLSAWIKAYDGQELRAVLFENRYRFIPQSRINSAEQREIAATFLTAYEVRPPAEDIIPWELAGNHIGKYMSVEGKIVRTHNSGKACFLNFHNNWTRYFSLVIFDNVFHRFPEKPEEFYRDKFVRVSGEIKLYRGRPEIVLNSPKQIEIIGLPMNKPFGSD